MLRGIGLALACWVLAGCAPASAPSSTAPPVAPPTQGAGPGVAQKAPPNPPALTPAAVPSPQVVGPRLFKVGALPTLGLAPLLIAQARGYLNQEAVTVEIVNYSNGADMVPALLNGQIDAGMSAAPSVALLSAVAQGQQVKIVASNGTLKAHRGFGSIVIRKDLAPPSGALDLKTLTPPIKAAATADGTLPHALILLEAEKAGLKSTDVAMTFMAMPDMAAALQATQVDLAVLDEPVVTLAEQQGIGVRWRDLAEDFPDLPYATVLFGPNLLDKDADGGVRLLRAYLQGVRDYEDALTRSKDRDAVVGMLSEPMRAAVQEGANAPFFDPNGSVTVAALQPIVDFWIRSGKVQTGFDLQRLVDPAPSQAAVLSLGVYK